MLGQVVGHSASQATTTPSSRDLLLDGIEQLRPDLTSGGRMMVPTWRVVWMPLRPRPLTMIGKGPTLRHLNRSAAHFVSVRVRNLEIAAPDRKHRAGR
jgi:hypothetical protein